jgi:ring-1,2-phenylacetyl-CoA epoxidase subunit PaaE
VFSQFANTKLKVGQALEVGEPEGKFIFEKSRPTKKLCCFCIWKWITPVLSIIKSVLTSLKAF